MIQKQIEMLVTNGQGFYKPSNKAEFRTVAGEKASLDMQLFGMELQRHSPSADTEYMTEFKKSTKYRLYTAMKEFVEYIVKNLVDNPDQVRINEVGGTHTLIIELSVEKSDIGKIIGKRGKTINAIRTLLMSVASRNGIRVNLEILEDEKETSSQKQPE